jgi:hypothetical protein
MIDKMIARLLTDQFKTRIYPCQQENSSCVTHGFRTSICGKLERALEEDGDEKIGKKRIRKMWQPGCCCVASGLPNNCF